MSESPLPEDLSLWPHSPYDLLGVKSGASELELRRAYVRLIRSWKPEQFPEHFKRIRDAYESLLRFKSYFESGAQEEELALAAPLEGVPALQSPLNDLEAPWRLALDGQLEPAYRRFTEMDQRRSGREDVALRLYWLLTLQRDLDPKRVPCDWLAQGLVNNGVTGPLRQLYLRELAADPTEATTPRCDRLLALPIAPGRLADLAQARWTALVKLGHWNRLWDEIETLRDRIAPQDEHAWLRLLLGLAEHVAWIDQTGAYDVLERCRREIKGLEPLTIHFPSDFDRLDALLQAAELLDWSEQLPADFLRLIAQSWTQDFVFIRSLVETVLAQIAAQPREWLGYLALVGQKASPALAQFGRLLHQLQQVQEWVAPQPDPSETAELVREFFACENDSYDNTRKRLLDFCTREVTAPEQLAAAILEKPEEWPKWLRPIARHIVDDWPLRYVYQAWALFSE